MENPLVLRFMTRYKLTFEDMSRYSNLLVRQYYIAFLKVIRNAVIACISCYIQCKAEYWSVTKKRFCGVVFLFLHSVRSMAVIQVPVLRAFCQGTKKCRGCKYILLTGRYILGYKPARILCKMFNMLILYIFTI